MQEEVIQDVTALVKAAEPCSTGEGDQGNETEPVEKGLKRKADERSSGAKTTARAAATSQLLATTIIEKDTALREQNQELERLRKQLKQFKTPAPASPAPAAAPAPTPNTPEVQVK